MFHTKDRSRDILDLYIWSSSEDQPSTGSCLHPDFWLLPALDARHHAHQEHHFDIKGFPSAFSVALSVRSSPSSVPFVEARPRPVAQRGSRQAEGHVHEDNSQRRPSPRSCSPSILRQGYVSHPGSQQKFCPTSCSALRPEHRKAYGEEISVTVLCMKHRINRITRDVEGIKDDEVLPKDKEHLALPLKTSPSMLSKVNKLYKYSFF